MSRIGSIFGLGTDQIRALNRLNELAQAISKSQQRLSTLRRINSAADDPSGLVQATLLETELKAAEEASEGLTRAGALLSTADTTAQEILTQLQQARSLALAAADGTLSSSDVAANQVQIDQILDTIDSLARTEFNGRRLLDGTSGFRATGVSAKPGCAV